MRSQMKRQQRHKKFWWECGQTEKAWGCRQTSWFGAAVRSKTSFFLLVLQVQPGTWQWPGRVPAACWWTGSTSYCLNQMQDGILRYWTKRVFCKNAGISGKALHFHMHRPAEGVLNPWSSEVEGSQFIAMSQIFSKCVYFITYHKNLE